MRPNSTAPPTNPSTAPHVSPNLPSSWGEWITRLQLAVYLGVTTGALATWERQKMMPAATRLGTRTLRYSRSAIVEWLAQREAAAQREGQG
jgi:predicted DNA-binding transcriptional regulator AlpA